MGLKDYKINPETAEAGLWVGFSANADKSIPAFKLARTSKANKKYHAALAKAQKDFRRQIQTDTLSESQSAEIMLEVFCNTVVLDWRHIQPEDDGKEIPFNKENVKALLSAPEWEVLYGELVTEAAKIGNIRDEQVKSDAKN